MDFASIQCFATTDTVAPYGLAIGIKIISLAC